MQAATHRTRASIATASCDSTGSTLGAEDRAERIRERVDCELLARDGGSLEQRQARERSLQIRRVGVDDAVTVDAKPHGRPLAGAGGVSEALDHETNEGWARAKGT